MKCSDIHLLLLRRRFAAIDLATTAWRQVRTEAGLEAGVHQEKCLQRLVAAGMLRRVKRGVYEVIDPAREVPTVAVVSGTYGQRSHYVTTDAALAFHQLIDQPLLEIVVCVPRGTALSPFGIGSVRVRASEVAADVFEGTDHYQTTIERYPIQIASRTQAILDGLDQPAAMTHFSLLPEVLGSLHRDEIAELGALASNRSKAAGQRLAFLLEEARVPIPRALRSLKPTSAVDLRPGKRSGVFSTRWMVYA